MRTVRLSILVCVLLLGACGVPAATTAVSATPGIPAIETFTPFAAGTETALAFASSTPVESDSIALPTLPPPTPLDLPTVVKTPSVASELTFDLIAPILYGDYHQFILLGATYGGNWLYPVEVYPLLGDPHVYDFYDPAYQPFQTTALVPPPNLAPGPGHCDYFDVQFVEQVTGGEPPHLGVKPGQPVLFRPIDVLEGDNDIYQQYLEEWLTLHGLQSPNVNITKTLWVDIEGDAVDEVIIVASNFKEPSGHMAEAGDYSVVLMRKVIGAQVYTVPLAADIYYNEVPWLRFPVTYDVDQVYDLNGDGNLEIILSGRWWEGSGLFVYEVHGLNAAKVLHLTCGLVSH